MLGRRQIREKVVVTLYAQHQNPVPYEQLEKKMLQDIEKIYDLYVYELNFLVALKQLAERQIDISQQKFIKNTVAVEALQKFIQNPVLTVLEENQARLSHTSKHQELKWELHDESLVKIFQKITASKRFQDFVDLPSPSFEDSQKFIGKIFLRYVAENDDLHALLEEQELSWADDLHITNSMIQKTIGALKEGENPHTLIRMIKDEEDARFSTKLLWEAVRNWEANDEKLKPMLNNWELDRLALMDRVILNAALTELDFFPQTPSRVIMNEYIEISKVFATEKSNVFINGILDKYTKEKNRI